jgi:pSer/pThr/pTyr-binding forkhead associated (FHA) protein
MIQIKILSGKKAGTSWVARRFPVQIGRAPQCDVRLEDAGVWDRHLSLDLRRGQGFLLSPESDAILAVNSQSVHQPVFLRNGDTIDIGGTRLQFWLAPARQRGLALRESLTWIALTVVTITQIVLIYFLLD